MVALIDTNGDPAAGWRREADSAVGSPAGSVVDGEVGCTVKGFRLVQPTVSGGPNGRRPIKSAGPG